MTAVLRMAVCLRKSVVLSPLDGKSPIICYLFTCFYIYILFLLIVCVRFKKTYVGNIKFREFNSEILFDHTMILKEAFQVYIHSTAD